MARKESILSRIFDFFGCDNTRELLAKLAGIAMSVYALYYGFFGGIEGFKLRFTHLFFGLLCVFLWYPIKRQKQQNVEFEQAMEEAGVTVDADSAKKEQSKKSKGIGDKLAVAVDVIAILAIIAVFGYLYINYDWISTRMHYVGDLPLEVYILGILLVILVLEGTRRATGAILAGVGVVFIAYWFAGKYLPGILSHAGYSLKMFIDANYLCPDGIFGTSIAASAQYIVLFVIFGALLEQAGLGRLMMDFCLGIFGKKRGGPALVAVVGSACVGTFSGSAAANVLTTGSVSIPLMKSIGFKSDMAGGVEAAASTGGMIMPPVMGAIAFLMAEFLGVKYIQICAWALLPAVLYFLSIGFQVYLHAQKMENIATLSDDQIPNWKKTAAMCWMSLIPLVVLLVILIRGYSVQYAVSRAIIVGFVVCMIRKHTRFSFKSFFQMLSRAAKSALSIVCACACAGIVVGVVSITGLGNRLNIVLLELAGSSVLLALLLTAISAIILGMGMPAAASYIVQYATVIPTLVSLLTQEGFENATICAHMFCLYFCNLSAITPPVALAAYAGATVAQSNPMKVGFQACRLAITAFIVPFMFVYSPELLLIGSAFDIVLAAVTSVIGAFGISVALEGYVIRRIGIVQRVAAGIGGVLMIIPGITTDLIGIALLALVIAMAFIGKKRSLAAGNNV